MDLREKEVYIYVSTLGSKYGGGFNFKKISLPSLPSSIEYALSDFYACICELLSFLNIKFSR